MALIEMPVAELLRCAAPYNPRRIDSEDLERLRNSLRAFGCVEPVIFNSKTRHIVGGHQRVKAAEAEGWQSIPVYEVELEAGEEKQLNLALNKISGEWDVEKLSELLSGMFADGIDLELTGFSDEELERLIPEFNRADGETDPDDAPALAEDPQTKPGDLWLLGPHRLICGDAQDAAMLEALMEGYLADLIITDPPYNVDYEAKTKSHPKFHRPGLSSIANDHRTDAEFESFLRDSFTRMIDNAKPGAVIYVFHADSLGREFRTAFQDSGWRLAQCCIWVKQRLVMGRQDYQWQHEPVLYGWKPKGSHRWYSDRKQTTLWEFDRPDKSFEHPTMKPVEMLEYLIRNSSREGDVVLDPFGGSGSTLIAAQIRSRKARLIELDPRYCDVIVGRWQAFTGQKATTADGREFLSSGERA